jgi:hypothetical protein
MTIKTKAKDRTFEAKDIFVCSPGSSRPRPVLEDYITEMI